MISIGRLVSRFSRRTQAAPLRDTWEEIRPFLNGNCGTNFQP